MHARHTHDRRIWRRRVRELDGTAMEESERWPAVQRCTPNCMIWRPYRARRGAAPYVLACVQGGYGTPHDARQHTGRNAQGGAYPASFFFLLVHAREGMCRTVQCNYALSRFVWLPIIHYSCIFRATLSQLFGYMQTYL
jgi:hypothetical protein